MGAGEVEVGVWTGGSQKGNSLETTRQRLAISLPPSRWQETNA